MNSFEALSQEFAALNSSMKVEATKLKQRCLNLKNSMGDVTLYPWDDLIMKIDYLLKSKRGVTEQVLVIDESPFAQVIGHGIPRGLMHTTASFNPDEQLLSRVAGSEPIRPKPTGLKRLADKIRQEVDTHGIKFKLGDQHGREE